MEALHTAMNDYDADNINWARIAAANRYVYNFKMATVVAGQADDGAAKEMAHRLKEAVARRLTNPNFFINKAQCYVAVQASPERLRLVSTRRSILRNLRRAEWGRQPEDEARARPGQPDHLGVECGGGLGGQERPSPADYGDGDERRRWEMETSRRMGTTNQLATLRRGVCYVRGLSDDPEGNAGRGLLTSLSLGRRASRLRGGSDA